MRTKADILAALEAERLDQTWWVTPKPTHSPITEQDDDLAIRRRRRDIREASRHFDEGSPISAQES